MAIQIPNAGTGNGATGDNEFVLWTKVINNFSDQTNAASRLVGTGAEQIPLSKDIPSLLGGTAASKSVGLARKELAHNEDLFQAMYGSTTGGNIVKYSTTGATSLNDTSALTGRRVEITKAELDATTTIPDDLKGAIFILETLRTTAYYEQTLYDVTGTSSNVYKRVLWGTWKGWRYFWNSSNATKDANGFLKGASPIVKVFSDKVELNDEAEDQDVTYKKNGIGDYTITTVSGLSTDGWYIELPKDMNGNPKVAVTLEETNGVISLRTYKRIFSMETFTFEPDLDNPLDIPDTRWIDLRLNEIHVEIEDDIQAEV